MAGNGDSIGVEKRNVKPTKTIGQKFMQPSKFERHNDVGRGKTRPFVSERASENSEGAKGRGAQKQGP